MLKARQGLPMSEEEHNEWVNAFKDIEESIEQLKLSEDLETGKKYKQQELF